MTEFLRTDIEINSNQLKMKRAGGGLPKSAGGGSQPPPDGGVRSEPKAGSRYDPGREGVLMCIPDLQNLCHLPASMSARQEPEGPPSTLTAREAGRKRGLLRRGPQPGLGGGAVVRGTGGPAGGPGGQELVCFHGSRSQVTPAKPTLYLGFYSPPFWNDLYSDGKLLLLANSGSAAGRSRN